MSNQVLNINSDAVVKFTNKLEKLKRSDLPIAIRETLNNAAFDMKQDTILKSTDKEFIKRRPSFFKAKSKVFKANGFDLNTMKSTVGFVGNEQAVDDLEQQEKGGKIGSRDYLAQKAARIGNSEKKSVRANARIKQIKKSEIVHQSKAPGTTENEKFHKSVAFAGVGGLLIGNVGSRKILWRINSLEKTTDGRYKLTALYSYDEGRSVQVSQTNFMLKASEMTKNKIESFFIQQAQKRIERALK